MPQLSLMSRLSGFYFFYFSVVGTFMPYWNLYLKSEGFNYQEIGILSSIAVITRFFAPLLWGWIADKFAKRMLLIRIATWMESFVWLLIFIIPNDFQSVAMLMLIFSFFQNAILAQFEGVTLFWLGEQRATLYGKVRKWGSVGFITGVFSVGAILDIVSIKNLPIILLCITSLVFLWSFTIKEPDHAPQAQKKLEPIYKTLKKPAVLAFLGIEFILLFSHAPFYSFYSNYLSEAGFSTLQTGSLWAVGVISEILMFAYAQIFLKHFSTRKLIGVCLIMTSLRWFIVGVSASNFVTQLAAQTLHAFSFGLFHLIAMRFIFCYFTSAQQGRAQALYSTVWGIGVAIGSILTGHFWNIWGSSYIFISAAGVVLFGFILLHWLPEHFENKENVLTK